MAKESHKRALRLSKGRKERLNRIEAGAVEEEKKKLQQKEKTADDYNKEVFGGVNWGKLGFKSAHSIRFKDVARCPTCRYPVLLKTLVADLFPYQHTDIMLQCLKCGWHGVFGIPAIPLFGMELIIWDTDEEAVLKQAKAMEQPICPFHMKKMRVTKIWGDKVMENPKFIRVQWKCNEWYLVSQLTVDRETPSQFKSTEASDQYKAEMQEKLKRLGYID